MILKRVLDALLPVMIDSFASAALLDVGQLRGGHGRSGVVLAGSGQRANFDRRQTGAVSVVSSHRHLVHCERTQVVDGRRVLIADHLPIRNQLATFHFFFLIHENAL